MLVIYSKVFKQPWLGDIAGIKYVEDDGGKRAKAAFELLKTITYRACRDDTDLHIAQLIFALRLATCTAGNIHVFLINVDTKIPFPALDGSINFGTWLDSTANNCFIVIIKYIRVDLKLHFYAEMMRRRLLQPIHLWH